MTILEFITIILATVSLSFLAGAYRKDQEEEFVAILIFVLAMFLGTIALTLRFSGAN